MGRFEMIWITKKLAVSSMSWVEVKKPKGITIVDVRDLKDVGENDEKLFKSKVDKVETNIKSGKKVVICCDSGINRSSAVALAYLIRTGMSFEEAYELIKRKNPLAEIDVDLLNLVRKVSK